MNIKLATICFAITALVSPVIAQAADSDTDRMHPGTFVKDSVITTKIKTRLAAEKISSLAKISVDTSSKGEVTLSGKVRSQDEAEKALSIARGTEGVTSVKHTLRVTKDD
jgi:hyperosmotically inducible periplasmic protein